MSRYQDLPDVVRVFIALLHRRFCVPCAAEQPNRREPSIAVSDAVYSPSAEITAGENTPNTDDRTTSLSVCLVVRQEPGTTGTSRYADELARGLSAAGIRQITLATRPRGLALQVFSAMRKVGADLPAFLAHYPIRLGWPKADVYHLTVQTYASALLLGRPPGPVVVTVHDIIPHLVRGDRTFNAYGHLPHRVFDRVAMEGLKRADSLIADSSWTKQTLLNELGIEPSRVTVVPLGVDSKRYRPLRVPASFRMRYALPPGPRYVLYVGSEDRRKNLGALWRAVAQVRRKDSNIQLLKVGASYDPAERMRLQQLAAELGIARWVRVFDQVPDDDLPYFYNAASVLAMPSFYEGFGLPVLEALACGAPVVCANTSALQELSGEHIWRCEPTAEGLAEGLQQALAETWISRSTRRAERAGGFSWEATARHTRAVYLRALRL